MLLVLYNITYTHSYSLPPRDDPNQIRTPRRECEEVYSSNLYKAFNHSYKSVYSVGSFNTYSTYMEYMNGLGFLVVVFFFVELLPLEEANFLLVSLRKSTLLYRFSKLSLPFTVSERWLATVLP